VPDAARLSIPILTLFCRHASIVSLNIVSVTTKHHVAAVAKHQSNRSTNIDDHFDKSLSEIQQWFVAQRIAQQRRQRAEKGLEFWLEFARNFDRWRRQTNRCIGVIIIVALPGARGTILRTHCEISGGAFAITSNASSQSTSNGTSRSSSPRELPFENQNEYALYRSQKCAIILSDGDVGHHRRRRNGGRLN
jgi:hypothetical protein